MSPLNRIPDDGTMEAALYGSAHIQTVLAREDGQKLIAAFDSRIAATMSELDTDLAASICSQAPQLIHSDEDLSSGEWPEDVVRTVMQLRYIKRQMLGAEIVSGWMAAADHRGRLIGLGEHSARASVSGSADENYKAAILWGMTP